MSYRDKLKREKEKKQEESNSEILEIITRRKDEMNREYVSYRKDVSSNEVYRAVESHIFKEMLDELEIVAGDTPATQAEAVAMFRFAMGFRYNND